MNRNRKIVVLLAIGLVALGLTTGWSVLAGATWPPEPMPVCSVAGTWGMPSTGTMDLLTISPEDPKTGKGSYTQTPINPDYTQGGAMAGADSWTPFFGTYVRTGPNTWQYKRVCYVKKDTKPSPTILFILVVEGTWTMMVPDAFEGVGTMSVYLPSQATAGDGIPAAGQKPVFSLPPGTAHMKAL